MEGEIDKALNKDQSEQDLFQSAIACTCKTAFEDMCQIKKIWHKEKGVQGFHLVQSFAPGEISPELAHQIGMEFADRLLGGKFQAVVSTHLNTKCIHNHIVWNSVSMENGKKYRSNEKTYVTGVRKISDELCVKHRLSVIHTEKSERVARPYALWLAEQNGTYTWKTPIQKDIEEAIAASLTWKQFLRVMEKQGYAFRFDRKYATMILPGTGRTVRFKTLGKNYTPEAIQNRILYPMPIGMLVTLDAIFNRVIQNWKKGKTTWVFADEFYLLFRYQYSADFFYKLWKRIRKYNGLVTGLTQNVEELLRSDTARLMLANSEVLLLLNQSSTDRDELANLLHISDTQLGYITNVSAGCGLIRCAGNIVPFENSFPRNTRLYQLMTTKPDEALRGV